MFRTVTIVVVLIAAVLLYAATKPDIFRIQRSTDIQASPEKIFPYVNDLTRLAVWSPFEKKDSAIKKSYRGPAAGKGAISEWDGNKEVGRGRLEIMESSPMSKVVMNLEMIKPFEAYNVVEFTLEPHGQGTTVTWAMQGRLSYALKIVHVFFDADKMVGRDFESGLADLKALVEK